MDKQNNNHWPPHHNEATSASHRDHYESDGLRERPLFSSGNSALAVIMLLLAIFAVQEIKWSSFMPMFCDTGRKTPTPWQHVPDPTGAGE